MEITGSTVTLSSTREAVSRHRQSEQLQWWRDGGGSAGTSPADPGRPGLAVAAQRASSQGLRGIANALANGPAPATDAEISPRGRALQPQPVAVNGDDIEAPDANEELELLVLKLLIEYLTQREIKLIKAEDMVDPNGGGAATDYEGLDPNAAQERPQRSGWGLRYDYYESYYEAESTEFSAAALVQTSDGREIEIDLQLNMSREFASEQSVQIRAGDARLKDPLVLNFNGNAAQLTREKISFDIDVDGRDDQISFVTADSGFLALDKNDNGRIDDGGELFGAVSGNGFADLAAYDEDGNQWIDEGDSIYEHLRVWTRDADGEQRLVALGARNVGAIYLGHVDTAFKIADQDNRQLGQIRDSGLFLYESGAAGTLQQIDLIA